MAAPNKRLAACVKTGDDLDMKLVTSAFTDRLIVLSTAWLTHRAVAHGG